MSYSEHNTEDWNGDENRNAAERLRRWHFSKSDKPCRCPVAWASEVESLLLDLHRRFPQARLVQFGQLVGRMFLVVRGLNDEESAQLKEMIMRCELRLSKRGAYQDLSQLLGILEKAPEPTGGRVPRRPYAELLARLEKESREGTPCPGEE